ncbi:MAG: outer membrane beta-barrel protein [Ferruginibacter sp.]|nr:outer membrane beta-barrel protein [Ferruginibacter sp.]
MKQLIYFFLPLFVSDAATAQTKIAIKAGANMATARIYQDGQKLDSKFNPGYGAGILFKAPFEGLLHFSPSLSYNRRGYTYLPKEGNITQYKNTIHYIDIVPSLSVDFSLGQNSLVISAGPHASMAIAGTEKTSVGTASNTSKMKFSTSKNYGLFDLGFTGSIGYHLKRVFIETGFQLGLANINNNVETDKRNIRNRMVSLQFGYYLK